MPKKNAKKQDSPVPTETSVKDSQASPGTASERQENVYVTQVSDPVSVFQKGLAEFHKALKPLFIQGDWRLELIVVGDNSRKVLIDPSNAPLPEKPDSPFVLQIEYLIELRGRKYTFTHTVSGREFENLKWPAPSFVSFVMSRLDNAFREVTHCFSNGIFTVPSMDPARPYSNDETELRRDIARVTSQG